LLDDTTVANPACNLSAKVDIGFTQQFIHLRNADFAHFPRHVPDHRREPYSAHAATDPIRDH
jgi:hypothetical protein